MVETNIFKAKLKSSDTGRWASSRGKWTTNLSSLSASTVFKNVLLLLYGRSSFVLFSDGSRIPSESKVYKSEITAFLDIRIVTNNAVLSWASEMGFISMTDRPNLVSFAASPDSNNFHPPVISFPDTSVPIKISIGQTSWSWRWMLNV